MKETENMVLFWDGPFSNWAPVRFIYDDIVWSNSEQLFMYIKAMCFDDYPRAELIKNEPNPRICKQLGREVANFNQEKWLIHREPAMFLACFPKYSQNPYFGELLLKTEDKIIVEASPFDKIWGIGLREDDPRALDQSKWKGLNLLGKTLMRVRDELNSKPA